MNLDEVSLDEGVINMKKVVQAVLRTMAISCFVFSLLVIAGCASQKQEKAPADSEIETQAIIIYARDGDYLFIDTETDTPFFPNLMNANIKNDSGQVLSVENLAVGDTVVLAGDGAMTMSYPAHYSGISEVTVVSRGNMDEVAEYSETIALIFPPIDESAVPAGWLDYDSSLGHIMLALSPYKYEGFTNNNLGIGSQTANGLYTDANGFISGLTPDAHFTGSRQTTIGFTNDFQSVMVDRVPITDPHAHRLHVDLTAPQESVENDVIGGGELSLTIEPGYLYLVHVNFAQGEASYAFVTLES